MTPRNARLCGQGRPQPVPAGGFADTGHQRTWRRVVGTGPPTSADDPRCHRHRVILVMLCRGSRWRRPPSRHHRLHGRQRSPRFAADLPLTTAGFPLVKPPSSPPRRPRPPRRRRGSSIYTRRSGRYSCGVNATPTRPRTIPPFALAAQVQLTLVFRRPAPHPVDLMRCQRVLQALTPHPARRADLLGPGDLPGGWPARGDWEEELRISLLAGSRPPPVTPLLWRRTRLAG